MSSSPTRAPSRPTAAGDRAASSCTPARCAWRVRADLGGAVAGLWHGETPILRSTEPARAGVGARVGDVSARAVLEPARLPALSLARPATTRRAPTSPTRRIRCTASAGSGRGGSSPRARSRSCSSCATPATPTGRSRSPRASTSRSTPRRSARACSSATTATIEQPVGLGWHPYFVKRPRSRMHIELSRPLGRRRDLAADAQGRRSTASTATCRTSTSTTASKAGAGRRGSATSASRCSSRRRCRTSSSTRRRSATTSASSRSATSATRSTWPSRRRTAWSPSRPARRSMRWLRLDVAVL